MAELATIDDLLAGLNSQQRTAATHGEGPLLIVAGAGTGKTATLVHRVAWLIAGGVDPSRILLLTFTRRAAAEMLRRAEILLHRLGHPGAGRVWGGTYHAIATRLLHRYGKAIGLPPDFAVHDRADSEDLMNVVRTDLNLAKTDKRFPKKGTCMAIYSRAVNAREKLESVLENHFPWCEDWREELKLLFNGYVDRKEAAGVLDYDDLLLYWHALLNDEAASAESPRLQPGPLPKGEGKKRVGDVVRGLFDCILIDEFQDTNTLQAEILYALSPEGKGLTVVGDDAQSIYAFRAATVRNILDFPKHYPGATIVTLEQNYRSTEPILDATNQVIALARERYTKNLWSERTEGQRPVLVNCEDDGDQATYVIRRILEHREAGIDLRRQAVLFRASHHSILLEAELARANIPFHKYGGLKFIETAHVKDLMAFLRLAENPRDMVAGSRLLPLLPGVGPGKARQLMDALLAAGGNFDVWADWRPPAAAATLWPKFVSLLKSLVRTADELPVQLNRVRKFYAPLLEGKYDHVEPRLRDLEQLELIASRYRNRARMLLEMTLDPPSSTQDLAGPPQLDDDYLVLSTIHSAKGLEWDAVYVIHAADGNIPSDMATKNPEEIEEERRLFYVALTRAKNWLYVCYPLRYYYPGRSDRHTFAQRTRFLPSALLHCFDQCVPETPDAGDDGADGCSACDASRQVRRRIRELWG
ncbi:MAG: ATP-dependent helicase [Planctomycetaceae bacterium]|nr:ATP-dependent helicase [Planctomycetaceae bacterium]